MRCRSKGRGSDQQPACRVVWHVIQDSAVQRLVEAEWEWFWSRVLTPGMPKMTEAPAGDTGASKNCELDFAYRRRGRAVTTNEVQTDDTPSDYIMSSNRT
jgi:hypothetical protein